MPDNPMDHILKLVFLILQYGLLLITFGFAVVRFANLYRHFDLAFGNNVEIRIRQVLSHDFTAFHAFNYFELVDCRPDQRLGPICEERRASHEVNLVVTEFIDHAPKVQVVILVRHDEKDAIMGALYIRGALSSGII